MNAARQALATPTAFHGSYAPDDVTFLLQPLPLDRTYLIDDLLEKERLIQTGQKHYSEMLTPEQLPTAPYLALFHAAVQANARRMARDVVHLARRIRAQRPGALTLVSLARAGTPVGVLLRRVLHELFAVNAPHYSVSIIRDKGLDPHALQHLLTRHPPESLAFIDGWTAKGTIHGELQRSLRSFETHHGVHLPAELFVLADLAGVACASGTTQDYLIPSALLNASVSGLVSRSVLNAEQGVNQFHGCLFYAHWQPHDLSRWFVQRVGQEIDLHGALWCREPLVPTSPQAAGHRTHEFMTNLTQRHGITDLHLLKPGLGEATRAMLRRAPRLLILRDPTSVEVCHLVQLAHERGVTLQVDPAMALHAVAVIRSVSDG